MAFLSPKPLAINPTAPHGVSKYSYFNNKGFIPGGCQDSEQSLFSSSERDSVQLSHIDINSESSSTASLYENRFTPSSNLYPRSNSTESLSLGSSAPQENAEKRVTFSSTTEEINVYRRALNDVLDMDYLQLRELKQLNREHAIERLLNNAKGKFARERYWSKPSDVVKSFKEQIQEMCGAIINHISSSNNWSCKVGFICHNCDYTWEVQHVINDLIRSIADPYNFLSSCLIQPPPHCMCPSREIIHDSTLQRKVRSTIEGDDPL